MKSRHLTSRTILALLSLVLFGRLTASAQGYIFTTLAGFPESPGNTDGAGSSARFRDPGAIAVDSAGNLYVADTGNHTIRKVTPAGAVSTLAGVAGSSGTEDGAYPDARFTSPDSIAIDGSGTVYVGESRQSTIRRIMSDGLVTTLAGLAGEYGDVDGPGPEARFRNVSSLATDRAGHLFVADRDNLRVRRIAPDGTVSTYADLRNLPRDTGSTNLSPPPYGPAALTVDLHGNVTVVDCSWFDGPDVLEGHWQSTFWKITPDGATLPWWNATVAATSGYVGSVTVDEFGRLFLATWDYDPLDAISQVPVAGGVTVIGGGRFPSRFADGPGVAARFRSPSGVAVDAAGNIYVADTGNHVIRKAVPVGTGSAGRLANLSVRARLVADRSLITGFVIGGDGHLILTRAIGPGLNLIVPDAASLAGDPRLALFDGASARIASNDNWGGSLEIDVASAAAGAFPLFASSRDAAWLGHLAGSYTAHIATNTNGVGLFELYDLGTGDPGRLTNLSARYHVGSGVDALIVGFVVEGSGQCLVLIRGAGPALAAAPFHLSGTLADPRLDIYNSAGERIAVSDNWSSSLASLAGQVGAFPLSLGSHDAATILSLQPGAYTAVLTGVGGGTGEGLIEVYEVR